jgi:hypothetical protein
MERNFTTDLRYGKKFENIVFDKLRSVGLQVIDTSKNKEYQKYDIDAEIIINNKKYFMEIKADKRINSTKNIFVEDMMERQEGNKKGWLHYCRSDLLCYVDDINRIAYIVNWPRLKKFCTEQSVESKYYRRFWNKTDNCYGAGYLIPLEFLRENNYIFKCLILEE